MNTITRRGALGAAAAAALTMACENASFAKLNEDEQSLVSNSRINQSLCRWCYKDIPLEKLAAHAKQIGLTAIDLLEPSDFPVIQKHGLVCSMTKSHQITKGINRKQNWDECLGLIRKGVEANADAGYPNVICFSGNTEGMDPHEGMKNCADALKQVLPLAEQKKITICMELLNSKHSHKDYMCDNSKWGVELVKMVGSERFKLLYDIFHMQIMEGDVIATIRQNKDYYAHYHTGGVPGRHEIDASQELNYPAIVKAIIDTGFKGYMAHEFIPVREPLASLDEAVKMCDV